MAIENTHIRINFLSATYFVWWISVKNAKLLEKLVKTLSYKLFKFIISCLVFLLLQSSMCKENEYELKYF